MLKVPENNIRKEKNILGSETQELGRQFKT
jgi:hypothetical protein